MGRQVARNPFRGGAGLVLLLTRFGLARQFAVEVPETHRMGPWVACTCGALVSLDRGELAECEHRCGRWFLRTESTIRVARWPVDDEAAA